MRKETLEMQVLKRIARKKGDVFLREDFGDLGGYDQVGRILKQLVAKGELIKVGKGLYARTTRSPFDGRPLPVRGLRTVREALQRLGVETRPTKIEQDYNAGRTTQVPTGRVIGVDRRIRRTIGYDGWVARFERA
jgi:hypothetical protein